MGVQMEDQVFVKDGQTMKSVVRSSYDTEAVFQRLLAEFPELLAGVTTTGDDETELVLIARELPIKAIGRVGSYSIDHVFVDRDATPILVEVKRSSDSRIRREVVGQLLDYATFAPRHWTPQTLRQAFVATHGLDAVLPATWPEDLDDFFVRVHRRLTDHDMRLVFVADDFPEEVIAVIEFLNEQMRDVEVLGVEVATYETGTDAAVLVPRVIGKTTDAMATKAGSGTKRTTPWTADELLAAAEGKHPPMVVHHLQQLIDHAQQFGVKQNWGTGTSPGFSSYYAVEDQVIPILTANAGTGTPNGRAYLQVYLPKIRPHVSDARFEPFIEQLEAIPELGRDIPTMAAQGFETNYASAYLDQLPDDGITLLLTAVDTLRDAGADRRDDQAAGAR